MPKPTVNRALRRSALTAALGLCFASGVQAQSNTTGSVFGQAEAGSVILIEGETGIGREIAVDADGRYRVTALPTGTYTVSEVRNGQTVGSRTVRVAIASGTEVSFVGPSDGAVELEGVTVTARAVPIDVSSVDTRTTLFADDLDKLPLPRSVTAAALLAPGVIAASPGYGNVPSFNGSSAAENGYYINGLSVVNPLTAIGFSELPYDAIAQQQVITGGYGAEFGRSTGGVINIVTKRGGNEWKFGGLMEWVPDWGRSDYPDRIYPNNGYDTDGTIRQAESANIRDDLTYGAYVSGPLVGDKLFFYATGEWTDIRSTYPNPTTSSSPANDDSNDLTKWLGKIDWYITDNHLLEVTAFGDKTRRSRDTRAFDIETGEFGEVLSNRIDKNSTEAFVGRYTGYLSNNLTINALYGETEGPSTYQLEGLDPTCPVIADARGTANPIRGCQPFGVLTVPNAVDTTEQWRFDVSYLIGDHEIRAGLDNIDINSFTGRSYAGPGHAWIYIPIADPSVPLGGNNNTVPNTTNVVYRQTFRTIAQVSTEQSAQYLEDRWRVTDNLLLSLGIRNEQFSNYNGSGELYVSKRNQIAPRLGFSWDVKGDSSFKVFGNAGRYHLPLPNNVAVRAASATTFTREWFEFDGFDPRTGIPNTVRQIGPLVFVNNSDGVAPDPRTIAAVDIESTYQDAIMVGFEKLVGNDWVVGSRLRHRRLQATIDDFCDSRSVFAYAEANDIEVTIPSVGCRLFNPGADNTFTFDLNDDGEFETLNMTAEDLGFPELDRTYTGLDLWVERPYDGNWYGRLDYTLSYNKGNAEGLLKSDIEQADVAVTQDWDAPELMDFSNGYLPNDRRHQLKSYGYWTPNEEWLFSAAVIATSGRPKNCIGYYLDDEDGNPTDPIGYGSSYFVCDGVPAPRGSRGRLPWTYNVNLGVQYKPEWAGEQITFGIDAINVLNRRNVLNIDETYAGSPGTISPTYGIPLNYNTPRYFRFTVRYDFGGRD